jgi:hypothetical protein
MEDRIVIATVLVLMMAAALALLVGYKLTQRRRFVERQKGRGKSGKHAGLTAAE